MNGPRHRYFAILILFALTVAIAWTIAGSGSSGLAQSAAMIVAIAKMDDGVSPTDFDFALTGQGQAGQWRVIVDSTASGGRAIEQSDTDRTDSRLCRSRSSAGTSSSSNQINATV